MKLKSNLLRLARISIFALCFTQIPFANSQNTKTVTLFADPWCPFTCGEKDANKGFLIELAEIILAPHGYKVEYKERSYARSIEDVRNGLGNAVAGALPDEAPDFVFPKNEQVVIRDCFFGADKNNSFKFEKFESLKGKKVGIIQDYEYSEEITKAIESKDPNYKFEAVSGVDTFKKNLQKLNSGRIDFLIEEDSVFSYYAKTNPDTKGVSLRGCLEPQKLYLAFSPHASQKALSDALAKHISDGMKDPKLASKREAIFKKYGLKAR